MHHHVYHRDGSADSEEQRTWLGLLRVGEPAIRDKAPQCLFDYRHQFHQGPRPLFSLSASAVSLSARRAGFHTVPGEPQLQSLFEMQLILSAFGNVINTYKHGTLDWWFVQGNVEVPDDVSLRVRAALAYDESTPNFTPAAGVPLPTTAFVPLGGRVVFQAVDGTGAPVSATFALASQPTSLVTGIESNCSGIRFCSDTRTLSRRVQPFRRFISAKSMLKLVLALRHRHCQ
jgi:hypothetical protein